MATDPLDELPMADRQHFEGRLRGEPVIWLTTRHLSGRLQSSPVWFVWDGADFLIYSRPAAQKVTNIRASADVSLHLEGDGAGGDIFVVEGRARVDEDKPPPHQVPAYLQKYEGRITHELGTSTDDFGGDYSLAIAVGPQRVRAWR